jgi:hypothetical protein
VDDGLDLLLVDDEAEYFCRAHHGRHTGSRLPIGEGLIAQTVEVSDDVGNSLANLFRVFRL